MLARTLLRTHVRLSGPAPRHAWRAAASRRLSSRAEDGPRDRWEEEEERLEKELFQRLNFNPEPKLRLPPPPVPGTHQESWAPAAHVSSVPDENALSFRSRYYISASDKPPPGANKVVLVAQVPRLGLSEEETARLIAVAGSKYNRNKRELRLTSTKFTEPQRNKADLRRILDSLLADARENAAAHAATPDKRLPLADRSPAARWRGPA